jgi:hypothetical protein
MYPGYLPLNCEGIRKSALVSGTLVLIGSG